MQVEEIVSAVLMLKLSGGAVRSSDAPDQRRGRGVPYRERKETGDADRNEGREGGDKDAWNVVSREFRRQSRPERRNDFGAPHGIFAGVIDTTPEGR